MADSDSNNNYSSDEHNSTTSNLPILFANGYPTSLEKMSEKQLELFIPFLIKCSLNLRFYGESHSAPRWWPLNIEYKIPFGRPKNYRKDWKQTMRDLVERCYTYHKQPFLLKYSRDLSENEPASLRFVNNNNNSTTSLYNRSSKKLLLTFRNENMLYDKKSDDNRISLLPKLWNGPTQQEDPPESNALKIYLCDNCEAELYTEEAYAEHEKTCSIIDNIVISDDDDYPDDLDEIQHDKYHFMFHHQLQSTTDDPAIPRRTASLIERSISPKKKKQPQRSRKVTSKKERELENQIPFSSPAGVEMTKKAVVNENYIKDTLERMEDYCAAPCIDKNTVGKWLQRPFHRRGFMTSSENTTWKEMRKIRPYYWPKKHFSSQSRKENFNFLNRLLIEQCKPLSVNVYKMTCDDIQYVNDKFLEVRKEKERIRTSESIDLCSDSDSDSIVMENDGNQTQTKQFNGKFFTVPLEATFSTPSLYQFKNQGCSKDEPKSSPIVPKVLKSPAISPSKSKSFYRQQELSYNLMPSTSAMGTTRNNGRRGHSSIGESPTYYMNESITSWLASY